MTQGQSFAALAEPRRRAILMLVKDRPVSVNDIARHFDITQQAVSQHLRTLHEAGLVDVHREGQRRLYVLRPEGLVAIRDFLADMWPQSLEQLRREVEASSDE